MKKLFAAIVAGLFAMTAVSGVLAADKKDDKKVEKKKDEKKKYQRRRNSRAGQRACPFHVRSAPKHSLHRSRYGPRRRAAKIAR